MRVYIAQMLRWGDSETHHYILGVFSNKEDAELVCDMEKSWRVCKYEPNVIEIMLDEFASDFQEKLEYHKQCV